MEVVVDKVQEWKNKHIGKSYGDTKLFCMFDLHVEVGVANALRRTIMTQIPTMAIHGAFIKKNTSCMHDTLIMNQLGQILIDANPAKFDFYKKSNNGNDKDKGFTLRNSIKFTLKVSGGVKGCLVLSGDLQCNRHDVTVLYQDMIITRLGPGEELELVCYATKNTGYEHVKWSPVSSVFYVQPEEQQQQQQQQQLQQQYKNTSSSTMFVQQQPPPLQFIIWSTGVFSARYILDKAILLLLTNNKK
jgi:DNA-directed RNA polymerase alpha subunit